MNRRHQPLDPEERALARLLDNAGDEGPSPEVDARILAAARESLSATAPSGASTPRSVHRPQGARRPRHRRLPLALGLAASVTLAVGVAWQLREPPTPATAAADAGFETVTIQAAPVPDAPVEAVAGHTAAPRPEAAIETTTTASPAPAAPAPPIPVAPAPTASATPEAPAPRTDALVVPAERETMARERERQAAEMASRRSMQRAEPVAGQAAKTAPAHAMRGLEETRQADAYTPPPAPVAAAAPPPPAPATAAIPAPRAAPLPAREIDPRHAEAAEAPAVATFADLAAADGTNDADMVAAVERDARLPVAQWLQRIRERQASGELALARASLARLVETHPAAPVPEDLQSLLP